ncbi:hypothetical protein F2Q68_00005083 [Brassica cretica]|uniref:Uncharacterized protein n=1 Tax=Brassica cretica TaxID=69181 RepID=A0A8S9JPX4_BRACR|nr:hypothetical protein F2Q68_00005083 [Brassica cretica]
MARHPFPLPPVPRCDEPEACSNDLVTRRLLEYLRVVWELGDCGGAEALLGSLDRVWDPEVSVIGPGGRMRVQGFSFRSGDRIGTLVYLDPEVVWEPGAFEAVLEPGGLDPEIVVWNPKEPGSSSLDPEIFDWNLKIGGSHKDPVFLGNPKCFVLSQGPYSTFLGKTTTGTCLDFAFCRSEAGHYRVPMLYSASAGSH